MRASDQALLEFIKDFIEANGYAPSFTQMMDGTGEKSKNGIHISLNRLEEDGRISKVKGVARSLRVMD